MSSDRAERLTLGNGSFVQPSPEAWAKLSGGLTPDIERNTQHLCELVVPIRLFD